MIKLRRWQSHIAQSNCSLLLHVLVDQTTLQMEQLIAQHLVVLKVEYLIRCIRIKRIKPVSNDFDLLKHVIVLFDHLVLRLDTFWVELGLD